MAATSMAAALAASLPAPSAAPVVAAPTFAQIPSSMNHLVDVEIEIPVTSVQLDGMVRSTRSLKIRFLDTSVLAIHRLLAKS